MPSTKTRNRNPNGVGKPRKKLLKQNGKSYEYWEMRVTIGYDEKGKQIVKSATAKTQKEAVEKARQIIRQHEDGTLLNKRTDTVEEWMEKWLSGSLNHVAATTAHEYRKKAETYIIPALGNERLQYLTPMQIQAFINSLSKANKSRKKGLSPKTVKDIHGVLHRALETAVEMKILVSNPANHTSLPKTAKIPRDYYDIPDIVLFLREIENHIHERYYLLLLMTGMREAEALGLTWRNIDFKNRVIHVRQQLQRNRDTGVYELVVPKREEIRDLPMGDELFEVLRKQQVYEKEKRKKCGNCWQDKNLVFSNQTGGFLSYRTVYDCYKRILKRCGLPDLRIHDLRHAFAMLALDNGDNVKTVQTLLGHKTPDFTLSVYAYTPQSIKKESGSRMDKRFRELRKLPEREEETGE